MGARPPVKLPLPPPDGDTPVSGVVGTALVDLAVMLRPLCAGLPLTVVRRNGSHEHVSHAASLADVAGALHVGA